MKAVERLQTCHERSKQFEVRNRADVAERDIAMGVGVRGMLPIFLKQVMFPPRRADNPVASNAPRGTTAESSCVASPFAFATTDASVQFDSMNILEPSAWRRKPIIE